MDKLERLSRLSALVEAAGGRVDGRKKLHKLTYLCQRAGTDIGQSFVFHMYGVYSPSLARDVEAAEAWHLIDENEVEGPGGHYEITTGPAAAANQCNTGNFDTQGLALVRQLAGESPSALEVLTTIAYLWDAGYREPRLREKLQQLKGHLAPYFAHAYDLATRHELLQ
jgi:uncharacterized protein YwgA